MRIIQKLTGKELSSLLDEFYKYFETGYEFEDFLKPFLECLGLTEVVVTKKSRDGGIDLIAVKDGLPELRNADSVKYRVQAKRYKPSSSISPEKIDALRGNLGFNEKGLFITTARVSDDAKEAAITKDPYKPVFVLDGEDLINLCIEKQVGFVYKPVFSKTALDEFTNKSIKTENNLNIGLETVEKRITSNDIRARIISLPRLIFENIVDNDTKHNIKLKVNNSDEYEVTFCPSRNYLSNKVTEIMKKYDMLQEDGTITEKSAIWAIDTNTQIIYLNI